MSDEKLTAKQVQEIIQAVQQAAQSAQQATQEAKQIAQSVSQVVSEAKQAVQGSSQEKASFISGESKYEETHVGEMTQKAVFSEGELWAYNKKILAASEQSERTRSLDLDRALKEIEVKTAQLELARKEHNFAMSQQLDHYKIIAAGNNSIFNHAVNMDYAKFNNAVSEPIAPNTKDDGSIAE